MKPINNYTLNELNKIVPSLTKEHLTSELPHIKAILKDLFWRLGSCIEDGIEIQEGVTSLNKFNEVDNSLRVIVSERVDHDWTSTKNASDWAKSHSEDYEMVVDLGRIRNARTYDAS